MVTGSVRARQERRFVADEAHRDHAMAVLIHGDASFIGQGITMEFSVCRKPELIM